MSGLAAVVPPGSSSLLSQIHEACGRIPSSIENDPEDESAFRLLDSLLSRYDGAVDWAMLSSACTAGNLRAVTALLDRVARLDCIGNTTWADPDPAAIASANAREPGAADPDAPALVPHPLWMAAGGGHVACVSAMLDADDKRGSRIPWRCLAQALDIALRRDRGDVADVLLSRRSPAAATATATATAAASAYKEVVASALPAMFTFRNHAALAVLLAKNMVALDVVATAESEAADNPLEALAALGIDVASAKRPGAKDTTSGQSMEEDVVLLACKSDDRDGVMMLLEAGAPVPPGSLRETKLVAMMGWGCLYQALQKQKDKIAETTTPTPTQLNTNTTTLQNTPQSEAAAAQVPSQPVPIKDMTVTELGQYITQKYPKLADCVPLFQQEKIDGSAFLMLTQTDLKELGLPMGHRKNLLAVIASAH